MGVIIGKVFAKDKEPETPEFIAPTPAQIQIIKETWEIPKAHLTDTGEYILFRFLDDFPKNQNKFEAFSNVPLLSLKVSASGSSLLLLYLSCILYLLRELLAFERMPIGCSQSFNRPSTAWTLKMYRGT